jgi:hypothetical protein
MLNRQLDWRQKTLDFKNSQAKKNPDKNLPGFNAISKRIMLF